MAEKTNIAWCDSSWNGWIGCTKVSDGCTNCYAEAMDARTIFQGQRHWGPGVPRMRTSAANWRKPLLWNAKRFMECGACGWRGECAAELVGCDRCGSIEHLNDARRRVFCASLADVFDNEVLPEWRADLWDLIDATPNLDWLLVTKRIGNVRSMIPDRWSVRVPDHVRILITVVNQEEADRDIPKLLALPCKNGISYEPALEQIDFGLLCENWSENIVMDPETGAYECCWACDYTGIGNAIDWIIVGGESAQGGHEARPFNIQWARSTIAQCKAAGVPSFVKQLGSNVASGDPETSGRYIFKDRAGADPAEWPEDLRVRESPR